MKIKILCTLGPASLRGDVIRALEERGVDLFRINLSHTPPEAVEPTITLIRRYSHVPICLDTQGAQVRCGKMAEGTALTSGTTVRLHAADVMGSATDMTLWPASAFASMRAGDLIHVDFDGALLQVMEVTDDHSGASAVVLDGGRVKSNRAVVMDPPPALGPITDKDTTAIEIGVRLGIRHYALSFASSAGDVELIRALVPDGSTIISKIESRAGVRNRDEIIDASDAVLIDRGDLSREVPVEYVPYYQKAIVRQANRWNTPVYVATNLLESMVTSSRATIAEMNDIANTLLDGVHGLVLAAETAMGVDPVGAVDAVMRCIKSFEHTSMGSLLEEDRLGRIA
ncbi:MAG TPA: pyruvate kinase [Acidimicrobiia bacterium]|nr:pyruvate kinase [Acidimicrobiia bacterium]